MNYKIMFWLAVAFILAYFGYRWYQAKKEVK
jgi:predicted negative regulator of RcsB-dependent stress response